ncbi:hypothetical protein [Myxosarcina sp. GI1]|uniref:hypothetical protein n=1 Tax=Myxosarcina sp. GI1 TaxID=1541065 RepID=UPI0012E0B920|nr:hypothetical protein [Myxosarcina sp. GI1]
MTLIIASIAVLIFALPSVAQDREILLRTSENMKSIEAWWDKLWDSTFNPPPIASGAVADVTGVENTTNLSLYAFVFPVRFLLAIGLGCWLYQYGIKMYEAKGAAMGTQVFMQMFFPVFLSIIFLANQAQYSRILAYGLRDVINSWSDGVMNLTIADINVRTAVQDLLVTEDAKEIILQKWQTCQGMPQPEVTIPGSERPESIDGGEAASQLTVEQRQVYDYLECLQQLSTFASERLAEADTARECSGFLCQSLKKLYSVLYDIGTKTYDRELSRRIGDETLATADPPPEFNVDDDLQDLAVDSEEFIASITNPSKRMLYFTQWMWISMLEMSLYLLALFAPMFLAVATIPNRQHLFGVWLTETLTIGLAKLAYIVVIGVVAVQKVSPENLSGVLDNTFFMTLGIFAPAVSFAVVASGGIAAATSYRNQSVGAIAIAGSAFSGAFATIGYTMARNFDKRR